MLIFTVSINYLIFLEKITLENVCSSLSKSYFKSLRFEIKDFDKKYKENAFGNETNTNHLNLINMRSLNSVLML